MKKVLATVVSKGQQREGDRLGERRRPPLDKDQCAYCKKKGPRVTGPKGDPLQILALSLEEEYRLFEAEPTEKSPEELQNWLRKFPQAWAETGGLGLARDQPPLMISLKASATPVSIRQYPMSREAHEGIKPHIRRLLDQGVLKPCQSPWNTPLLPVKKPGTGDDNLHPPSSEPPPSSRMTNYGWVLPPLDSWLCRTGSPIIPPH